MVAVTDKSWTLTAPQDFSVADLDEAIDAIATRIDADCTYWDVVDNDVVGTGRQILIESTDTDMANVKGAISGGDTPHASNIAGASSDSYLYAALHTNHPSDTFDADFDTSQILTGAGFVEGIVAYTNSITNANKIRFLEKSDTLWVLVYDNSDNNPFVAIPIGVIGKDFDGEQVLGVAGQGTTSSAVGSSAWGTSSGMIITGVANASPGTSPAVRVWHDNEAKQVCRLWTTIATSLQATMSDVTDSNVFSGDIPMFDENDKAVGFFQQMRLGPMRRNFDQMTATSGQKFWALADSLTVNDEALWLRDPAV